MNLVRAGSASGVVAGLLLLPGIMGHDVGPRLGETTPDELVAFFESEATLIQVGTVLGGLAAAFFLIWLGSLRGSLRLTEGRFGHISDVAFAGGLVTAAFYLIAVLCMAAPLFRDLAALDPTTVQTFYSFRLLGEVLWFSPFPVAVFVGAVSIAVLTWRILPRWTGWFGVLVTAMALLSGLRPLAGTGSTASGVLDAAGILMHFMFALWMVLTALIMTMRPVRARDGEAASVAGTV
ncbi:hypothetical protein [Blastococcus deserti]|uniref:DUF4386 family protein n=1 Tax=Blastococcus deserti TaxID=2259033 RepID=A0ABW4X8A4_9ACTN